MAGCICALKGAGEMYLFERGGDFAAAFTFGNGSDIQIAGETSEESLPDYTTVNNPPCATDETIDGITLTATMYEFCAKNKNVVWRGTSSRASAATVADDEYPAWPGKFIELSPLPDPNEALVVEPQGGGAAYTAGADYIRTKTGIYIPSTGSSITAPVSETTNNIQVDYEGLATDTIEALTTSGKEYTIIIDVMNTAVSGGSPERTVIHRAKPGIFTAFPIMGATFQSFPFSASVLPDNNITGDGLSKYFKQTIGVAPGA